MAARLKPIALTGGLTASAAMTDADLDAFQHCASERTEALAPSALGGADYAIGLGLGFGGAILAVLVHATAGRSGAVIVLLLLGAYAAGLLVMRRKVMQRADAIARLRRRSVSYLLEPRRYQLDEGGIQVKGITSEGAWSWQVLTEVGEAHGLLLFWVGHVTGFCIPKHGFATPEDAATALAFARAQIAAAQGRTVPAQRPEDAP